MTPGLLVTPAQWARMAGVSRTTVHRWIDSENAPAPVIRSGRVVRFARVDVLRFLARGTG